MSPSCSQENRQTQRASIDQQREIMRYLRSLNDWFERDVRDRYNEMRSLAERVDELRRLLGQMPRGGMSIKSSHSRT